MWTFRRPHHPFEMTTKSIEFQGEVTLSRALNIGRIVAFVGSGLSSSYGRPTWNELVLAAIQALGHRLLREDLDQLQKAAILAQTRELLSILSGGDDYRDFSARALAGELKEWTRTEHIGETDTKMVVLALAIRVARSLGGERWPDAKVELEVRKAVAHKVYEHEIERRSRLRIHGHDFDVFRDSFFALRLAEALRDAGHVSSPMAQTLRDDDGVIHTLIDELEIRRFLTVNYDLELERAVVSRNGLHLHDRDGGFVHLISRTFDGGSAGEPDHGPQDEGGAVIEARSAVQMTAQTSTIDDRSIGRLVNFAAHPHRFRTQIFHLHGRIDDPENMVLSEEDYQRLYLRDDLHRRTFEEGLNALFRGNDILFIGIGMTERDILRPLRQFVSQDRSPIRHGRHVFALMPRGVSEGTFEADQRRDALKTISLMAQYGVHVLRYGDRQYWVATRALDLAEKVLRGETVDSRRWKPVRRSLFGSNTTLQGFRDAMLLSNDDAVDDEALSFVRKRLRDLYLGTVDPDRIAPFVEVVRLLRSRIHTAALLRRLRELADGQAKWWRDWQRLSKPREPRFHVETGARPAVGGSDCVIWMRHHPSYQNFDSTPQLFDELREKVLEQVAWTALVTPVSGRRIASVIIPRGGGKGALTYWLSQSNRFKRLFSSNEIDYAGAFIGHLSFLVEFNSVIEALNLFLEDVLKTDPAWSDPEPDAGHPLDVLRCRLGDLQARPDGRRVFILLHGLDRLCGPDGIPMNATHRAFFRALTGIGRYSDDEDVPGAPIDVLFLSGRPGVAIRYTTEILEKRWLSTLEQVSDRFSDIGDSGFVQRVPPILPRLALADRGWLWSGPVAPIKADLLSRFEVSRDGIPVSAYPVLTQMMHDDTALSSWVIGALGEVIGRGEVAEGARTVSDWLRRAEFVASRDGASGVIEFVLETHSSSLDRREGLRDDLILKHLSLFPIPIEILVLYGCPELRQYLRPVDGRLCPQTRRTTQLAEMMKALDRLRRAHLIIRIEPRGQHGQSLPPRVKEEQDRLAYRYTIHPRLREYMTRRMGFPIPDNEDSGLFRISLFPYQGRDRPKASETHFELVKGILDYQIGRSKNTLWCFYQLHKVLQKKPGERSGGSCVWLRDDWDYLYYGLQRRLTVPGGGRRRDRHFEDDLAAVRSVSQRARACYALLRGGFSVGAINQIAVLDGSSDSERPLEQYHSWLRSLTNIASMLDELETTLEALRRPPIGKRAIGAAHGRAEATRRGRKKAVKPAGPKVRVRRAAAVAAKPVRPTRGPTVVRHGRGAEGPRWAWISRLIHRAAGLKSPVAESVYRRDGRPLVDQTISLREFVQPFYIDELGWIHNERGVLAYTQGNLFDALPLFDLALRVMSHREEPMQPNPARHSSERRILLNRALTDIDRGNLDRARQQLVQLVEVLKAPWSSPSITSLLAEGYLGLLDHLGGSYDAAAQAYDRILDFADGQENLRVASIFHRHKADLLRSQRRLEAAEQEALKAERAARQAGQQGLLHQARLTHSKILMEQEKWVRAQGMIQNAHDYAEQMGVPKIKVEALELSADLMHRQGETTLSGETAAEAIALATRHGMRLRKIAALQVLGNVMIKRGQRDLARDVREEARVDAERCRYQSRAGTLFNVLVGLQDDSSS